MMIMLTPSKRLERKLVKQNDKKGKKRVENKKKTQFGPKAPWRTNAYLFLEFIAFMMKVIPTPSRQSVINFH